MHPPPLKKRRISAPNPYKTPNKQPKALGPPKTDIVRQDNIYRIQRASSEYRLKAAWEAIFAKYDRDTSDYADELDLITGEIIVDKGHIRSLEKKVDPGIGDLWEEWGYSDNEHNEGEGEAVETGGKPKSKAKKKKKPAKVVLVAGEVFGITECQLCMEQDELDFTPCTHGEQSGTATPREAISTFSTPIQTPLIPRSPRASASVSSFEIYDTSDLEDELSTPIPSKHYIMSGSSNRAISSGLTPAINSIGLHTPASDTTAVQFKPRHSSPTLNHTHRNRSSPVPSSPPIHLPTSSPQHFSSISTPRPPPPPPPPRSSPPIRSSPLLQRQQQKRPVNVWAPLDDDPLAEKAWHTHHPDGSPPRPEYNPFSQRIGSSPPPFLSFSATEEDSDDEEDDADSVVFSDAAEIPLPPSPSPPPFTRNNIPPRTPSSKRKDTIPQKSRLHNEENIPPAFNSSPPPPPLPPTPQPMKQQTSKTKAGSLSSKNETSIPHKTPTSTTVPKTKTQKRPKADSETTPKAKTTALKIHKPPMARSRATTTLDGSTTNPPNPPNPPKTPKTPKTPKNPKPPKTPATAKPPKTSKTPKTVKGGNNTDTEELTTPNPIATTTTTSKKTATPKSTARKVKVEESMAKVAIHNSVLKRKRNGDGDGTGGRGTDDDIQLLSYVKTLYVPLSAGGGGRQTPIKIEDDSSDEEVGKVGSTRRGKSDGGATGVVRYSAGGREGVRKNLFPSSSPTAAPAASASRLGRRTNGQDGGNPATNTQTATIINTPPVKPGARPLPPWVGNLESHNKHHHKHTHHHHGVQNIPTPNGAGVPAAVSAGGACGDVGYTCGKAFCMKCLDGDSD